MHSFHFHKWTPWEYYKVHESGLNIFIHTVNIIVYKKKRHCEKCGEVQDKVIDQEQE